MYLQSGVTPLHSAATEGHENVIKLLLEAGADVDPIATDVSLFLT